MQNSNIDRIGIAFVPILFVSLIGGLVFLWMWGMPKYRIYKQDLRGQANLRQQEWEKKISIEGAKAKAESAKLEAAAEIERARGVAEANRIIGESLTNNEGYLRYLYVNGIAEKENQIIYVPTEAGLPILEAGKRN